MIFRTDNSSSAVADNIKTDVLILDKDPADGLDDNTITSEAEYLINFIGVRKVLPKAASNRSNRFLLIR